MEFEIFLQLNKYLLETQQKFTVTHDCFMVAGENIVTNNNLGKNNLSITTYAITTW